MLVTCDNEKCGIVFNKRPNKVARSKHHFHCPECLWEFERGPHNPHWRGGFYRHSNGYIRVWAPEHPHAESRGYVMEHRLVMEEHLGRYLTRDEVVHHINEQRDDNRIENLMLFSDNAEHLKHHIALEQSYKGANEDG